MMLNYVKSESTVKPELLDTTSSKRVVYLRRNIVEKQRKSEFADEIQTYYEYEEAKLTRTEWEVYQKELAVIDIQRQRADLDYIALMVGVDLEDAYEQDV